ncbi:MAG: hypothetical protein CME65_00935 [Halobacteriovoraceae bacterium]|nr:hypothetical protein [Halobacteriovoraceae bacterium]|tara:strand:+ start:4864 stop:5811 length:948 start_codon:yes stop_codon:yes gene_type:complete
MEEKLNILLFNFPSGATLPSELSEHYKNNEDATIETYETPLEASEFLNQAEQAIFIFIAKDNQDLSQVKLLLKRFKNKITNKNLRPIALIKNYNRDAVSVLKRLGCDEVYNHQLSTQRLIESIDKIHGEFLFNDPEIDEIEGLAEREQLSSEMDELTRIRNVTETNVDDSLHYKALEHPKLGGISLESGRMEINVSEDLPDNSEFFLEHFDSNELEFEIKTEDALALERGQNIELQIVFVYDRCRVEIMVEGQIDDILTENAESSIVALHLLDDESLKLEQFMALYQKRQSQIKEFMEVAKEGVLYNPFKKGEIA